MTELSLPRVSAVSYLNTCPLVWGFQHGPQRQSVDLRFELPAECAHSLETGSAEIGLVPVIEMFRQGLGIVSNVCISSDGPVRSIFLLHRGPIGEIRSLALDASSRTSAALTKIILAERYGVQASERTFLPNATEMLTAADAALIIGDPALRLNLASGEFQALDLGAEWQILTGLPMVYAVWASRNPPSNPDLFRRSYEYGRENLDAIIHREASKRQVSLNLAERYLTHHIRYDLTSRALAGLREFQRLSQIHGLL